MNDSKKTKTRFAGLGRAVWAVIAVWTGVIAASMTWNIFLVREEILDAARIQARVAYKKDIIYRRWNARHGGVYVPVSKGTEQNPYLSDIPERDITTPSGKRLTLMNPAYMTRQVHELAEEEYGVGGHITSLNPIRPQNAADPWETRALRAFESGKTEISSVEGMRGEEYMRLMRPLITEKNCLRCHAAYGSQEGDIRGGISVSIPMEPMWAISHRRAFRLLLGHGFLWLLGLVAIVFVMQRLTRSEKERTQAEESLRKAADELEKQVEERTREFLAANEELRVEIIDRKKAEKELSKHREHLEELVEDRTNELKEKTDKIEESRKALTYLVEDVNEAGEELRKVNTEYAAANKELKEFAYIVSHDLKAPLRAISQLTHWISEDYSEAFDADGKEQMALIINRVKRMDSLINGILRYSRVGRIREKEEHLDLNLLVNEVIATISPPDNVKIIIENELPDVLRDSVRMEQVFQNLIGNAIKFLDKDEGIIKVGCGDEGAYWKFSVSDNGPGIDKRYHDKIFQIFQTLTPRDTHESTGIGLTLVKKIIELYGGFVRVESEVGKGSTFVFTLPKK